MARKSRQRNRSAKSGPARQVDSAGPVKASRPSSDATTSSPATAGGVEVPQDGLAAETAAAAAAKTETAAVDLVPVEAGPDEPVPVEPVPVELVPDELVPANLGAIDLTAIEDNTRVLQSLVDQFDEFRQLLAPASTSEPAASSDREPDREPGHASPEELDQLRREVDELVAHLKELRDENQDLADDKSRLEQDNDELRQQAHDLAAQVAASNVRKTVSDTASRSGTSDALSWEDRKALILMQLEEDTFDAEAFVENLQQETATPHETPAEFIDQMKSDLDARDREIQRRDAEIGELRCLLEQQSQGGGEGVAIGAAAIAQMIDSDELVTQERERLQQLQAEWEEKFRQGEIKASLERAKLSRERQELANRTAELEEQLEHLRRESRQAAENGSSSSRRWLVKLGLAETDS